MRFFHIAIFIISLVALVEFRHDALFSMIISEVVTLYVIACNLNRREILPPLTFIILFKIIEYPIAIALYGGAIFQQLGYLGFIMTADLLLVLAVMSYRRPLIRALFRVRTPNLRIGQVNALCTLLGLGAFHILLVMSELAIYYFGLLSAESPPFFYRTFPEIRATLKVLMLLSIWSMMLDAHFNPFRLAKSDDATS
jgi:hypothetical protein